MAHALTIYAAPEKCLRNKTMIRRFVDSGEDQKRQELLDAGCRYGLEHGLASLSIDSLAKTTGISKRTIYNYYGAHNAFLEALIRHDGNAWREWIFDAVREQADAPLKRVFVFFETLAAWSCSSEFRGCLFAQVLCSPGAFPESACHAAREQMNLVRQYLDTHLNKARTPVPETSTDTLLIPTLLLLSGAANHVCENPGQHLMLIVKAVLSCSSQTEA
jgi:AcrR family transcriptional regulator